MRLSRVPEGVATGERWTAGEARTALAAAPELTLSWLLPAGGVLVVAPHPDDETLGCGGLIACAAQANRPVTVACLTDGAASHPASRDWPPARLAALRHRELIQATTVLAPGGAQVESFGAPDGCLDACETAAETWLANVAAAGSCTSIFTTWAADPHPDHKSAFRIAARVAAGLGAALFAYPIWGLTLPDAADAGPVGACSRLDISAVLELKQAAMAAYRSQTSALIEDDPQGFRLRPEDLERHLRSYEDFIEIHPQVRAGAA